MATLVPTTSLSSEMIDMEKLRIDSQKDVELSRQEAECKRQDRQTRLELLRHAKDILTENRRNAPVGEREVTHDEVIAYASELEKFINT